MQPIYWISGPPAAGKTTLSVALLNHFDLGFHLEVDDIRNMVKSGMADSVPWTEETERQFQVAEKAVCSIASTYQDNGFAVVVDHCRNLPRVSKVIDEGLPNRHVVKICLLPALEENLQRNSKRTNKSFDPEILVETIRFVHNRMRQEVSDGWLLLDNTSMSTEETVKRILDHQNL